MLKALRYEILRNVICGSRHSRLLAEKPVRVATLLSEDSFLKDQLMIHGVNVFLEDFGHDYDWNNGVFRYFTRVVELGQPADIVVAYEVDTKFVPPLVLNYDPMTGRALARVAAPFAELKPGRCRYVPPGGGDINARVIEVLAHADGELRIALTKGMVPTRLSDIPVLGVFLVNAAETA